MKKEAGFGFELISKYRAVLMGVAILAIVFCHVDTALKHNGLEVTRLANALHIFTVGVDIFMFLSGFGLYYSCKKHHYRYLDYLSRRVKRILPYYLVIGGITTLILAFQNHYSVARYFQDLFFISWYIRGATKYWFVLAILVFYAVFPPIFRMIDQEKKKATVSLVVLLFAFIVVTVLLDHSFELYGRFRIAIERFPIFVLGAYCGMLSAKKERLHPLPLACLITLGFAASAMLYLSDSYHHWISNTHYMYYLTRGLLAQAVMGTGILIMEALEKRKSEAYMGLSKTLSYLGGITLEIYLFHQSYLLILDFPYSAGGYLLAAVVLPLISAVVLNTVRGKIEKDRQRV